MGFNSAFKGLKDMQQWEGDYNDWNRCGGQDHCSLFRPLLSKRAGVSDSMSEDAYRTLLMV